MRSLKFHKTLIIASCLQCATKGLQISRKKGRSQRKRGEEEEEHRDIYRKRERGKRGRRREREKEIGVGKLKLSGNAASIFIGLVLTVNMKKYYDILNS